jgi:hypothetical protein
MKVLQNILEFNNIERDNIKISLMKESPFTFFRGTSHLFFEHLHYLLKREPLFKKETLLCWIQGDAHINNLGFSNKKSSKVKDVKFDLNDFDEAFIGNPLLDIIRFGVSIGFFFDDLKGEKEHLELIYRDTEFIEFFLRTYFKYAKLEKHAKYNWRGSKFMRSMKRRALKRTEAENEKSRINRFTFVQNEVRTFRRDREDILDISEEERVEILRELSHINVVEIVKRKSAGVGSAHLQRYYILSKDGEEYLLLELKEQLLSSYLHSFQEFSHFLDSNENVSDIHIRAKREMIKDSDIHMKSINLKGKSFLLKSLFNGKYSLGDKLYSENHLQFERNLKDYLKFSAIALSNAHKKSALDKKGFLKEMKRVSKEDFYRIETIILKSYATNLGMFSHFERDLGKRF